MLDPRPGLDAFGVRMVEPLGERVNAHWRVRDGHGDAVLRRWGYGTDAMRWEVDLVARLAEIGEPVATLERDPVEIDDVWWTLHRLLPGQHRPRTPEEQRARGRLLARIHRVTSDLSDVPQRPGWRTLQEVLEDPTLDALLARHESHDPTLPLLRRHLDRARLRWHECPLPDAPTVILHGDLTPTNVLWDGDLVSGLIDFEAARRDERIADFALSWRGLYDDVVHGYEEVTPLSEEERRLIGPFFWAYLAEGSAQVLRADPAGRDDGWTGRMVERRSALMGPDENWFPATDD